MHAHLAGDPAGPADAPRQPRPKTPVRHALLALQSSCGNRAVQRYIGEAGFNAPAAPNFGGTRAALSHDYQTTKGEDISDPHVANMSAATVVYCRQNSQHGPINILTESTEQVISGNPEQKRNRSRRLYESRGTVLSNRPQNRIDCSEPKTVSAVRRILDDLTTKPGADARPVVHFFSENLPCANCRTAIAQLAANCSWADVIVYWQTWFHADLAGAPAAWTGAAQVGGWYRLTFAHSTVRAPVPWPTAPAQHTDEKKRDATFNPWQILADEDTPMPGEATTESSSSTKRKADTKRKVDTVRKVDTAKAAVVVPQVTRELSMRPKKKEQLATVAPQQVVVNQAGQPRVSLSALQVLITTAGLLLALVIVLRQLGYL